MLGSKTLDLLFNRHQSTFRHLQMRCASVYWAGGPRLSPNLLTFLYTSIDDSESYDWPLELIRESRNTLRHLTFGRELRMANMYAVVGTIDREEDRILHDLQHDCQEAGPMDLSTLHLIGMGLPMPSTYPVAIKSPLTFLRPELLQVLRLESCIGTEDLLIGLTLVSNLSLKCFWLRSEVECPVLRSNLEMFLKSFSGLFYLSVLLDRTLELPGAECFLKTHGRTLKTLVWEGRTGPRMTAHACTSLRDPKPRMGNRLNQECSNLEELGIAIDWSRTVGTYISVSFEIRPRHTILYLTENSL